MKNMLEQHNWNFEQSWDGSHDCLVITEEGVEERVVDNIFTPPGGWLTWFDHRPGHDQPEVTDTAEIKLTDPRRGDGMRFFTTSRKHRGGFLITVPATPGARLSLSALAHAWSNHEDNDLFWCWSCHGTVRIPSGEEGVNCPKCDTGINRDCAKVFPHPHDGKWNEGAGFECVKWLKDDIPAVSGDPVEDAKGNFLFAVGIDPTGSGDPTSSDIVWGDPAWIYGGDCDDPYREVPPVEVIVQAEQVTAILMSWTLYPFEHNDAYWDQAVLEVVDQPATEVDYEVTVHTPYQEPGQMEENRARYRRVAQKTEETLGTLVGSVDDMIRLTDVLCPSGEGGLGILYEVPEAKVPEFETYVAERSTFTRLEFRDTVETDPLEQWSKYLLTQGDEEWGDYVYALGDCHTLASQGCYITCCAMAQRVFGIDPDATPVTVDMTLGKEGYSGCLLLWSYMPRLGMEVQGAPTDPDSACRHLDDSGLVFVEVEPDTMMHFVLAVEHDGEDFLVLDPLKGEVDWLYNLYDGAESFRLIGEVSDEPPAPPEVPDNAESLGLHLQIMEPGWDTFYRSLNSGEGTPIAKVFSPEDVLGIMRCAPDANIIVRYHTNHQSPYVWPDDGDYAAAGKRWVDNYRDTMYRVCDQVAQEFPGRREPYFYYESVNEEYENVNLSKNTATASLDLAVAKEVYETGYPIRAAIYTAAVGNMDPSQYELLVHMFGEACCDYGAVMGPHRYFIWNGEYGGPDHMWELFSGRHVEFDRVLRQHGYTGIKWYGGESGAIGGLTSPPEPPNSEGKGWVHFDSAAGWRYDEVYDGDWRLYQDHLLELRDRQQDTPIGNRGDDMGDVIFTSCGHWMGWKWFRIKSPQMDALRLAM
jgi:hypothetical protein